MEVRLLIEEAHRTQIAAQVGGAAQVHRAVHVAQEVNQHFEVEGLLFGRKSARPELRDDLRHGLQDVALRIRGHVVECPALVHVQVVPRLRVGIFGSVAGVVEPVGEIDGRIAAQHLVDLLRRGGRQVTLGNVGRHVMALLSPRKAAAGCEKTESEEKQFFHRCQGLSGSNGISGSSWRGTPRWNSSGSSASGGTPWPPRASCPRGICAAPTCGSSPRAAAAGPRGACPKR